MAIQPSDEQEFRQAYIEVLRSLTDRSREFLRRSETRGGNPPQRPGSDLVVSVDGQEVHQRDLASGRLKYQHFSPKAAEKLITAVERPEALQGVVTVAYGDQILFQNRNGNVTTDVLRLAREPMRRERRERARSPQETLDRVERRLAPYGDPNENVAAKLERIERKLDALLSRPIANPAADRWRQQTRRRVNNVWRQVRQAISHLIQQVRQLPARGQQAARARRDARTESQGLSGVERIHQLTQRGGQRQPDGSWVRQGKNHTYIAAPNGDLTVRQRGSNQTVVAHHQGQSSQAQVRASAQLDRVAARLEQSSNRLPRQGRTAR